MYGYQCEYCEGTVQPRLIKREAFKHRDSFVILEDEMRSQLINNINHLTPLSFQQ